MLSLKAAALEPVHRLISEETGCPEELQAKRFAVPNDRPACFAACNNLFEPGKPLVWIFRKKAAI